MRVVRIPLFVFFLLALLIATPLISWYDAGLFVNPETQSYVVVMPGSKEPTFLDIFWIYMKTNMWEIFLVSCGCVIAWITRNRRVTLKIP